MRREEKSMSVRMVKVVTLLEFAFQVASGWHWDEARVDLRMAEALLGKGAWAGLGLGVRAEAVELGRWTLGSKG